jgi:hypothetical protein
MVFVDRYVFMRETLRGLIQKYNPDKVGVESPPFGASYSEGMYGLFLYTNEALRAEHRDVVYFTPPQVKAHARESLKRPEHWDMKKPDMVAAAKADTATRKSWNHNDADAYLVARLAGRFWCYWGGALVDADLTPVEYQYFARTHTFTRGKRAGQTEKTGTIYREDDRFFLWSQVDPSGVTPVPPSTKDNG